MQHGKRAILRVQLNPSAKQGLEHWCLSRGMTQISVMSRLIEWFVIQEEAIQLSVMQVMSPQLSARIARQVLERMAAKVGDGIEAADSPAN